MVTSIGGFGYTDVFAPLTRITFTYYVSEHEKLDDHEHLQGSGHSGSERWQGCDRASRQGKHYNRSPIH